MSLCLSKEESPRSGLGRKKVHAARKRIRRPSSDASRSENDEQVQQGLRRCLEREKEGGRERREEDSPLADRCAGLSESDYRGLQALVHA